jgi:hypothetical protein
MSLKSYFSTTLSREVGLDMIEFSDLVSSLGSTPNIENAFKFLAFDAQNSRFASWIDGGGIPTIPSQLKELHSFSGVFARPALPLNGGVVLDLPANLYSRRV